jgi:putative addiction module killer protein
VLEIRETDTFSKWRRLTDRKATVKILARIDRLRLGNPRDVGPVGEGGVHYGPEYRVYFV